MNRFINMLLLVLLFPTMFLTIYVCFDLPIGFLKTTGAHLPYKFELFLGLGLLLFVINLRRSIRRWMGMRIVSKKKNLVLYSLKMFLYSFQTKNCLFLGFLYSFDINSGKPATKITVKNAHIKLTLSNHVSYFIEQNCNILKIES